MQIAKTHRVAGGELAYAAHECASTGTLMRLSVFTPPGAGPFPYLIWLSGLTCTEDNFTTKAGYPNRIISVELDDTVLAARRAAMDAKGAAAWKPVDR